MHNKKHGNQIKFNALAENINDPRKLYGWVFVVTLFSVASMLLSQTALYMALKMKFGGP